MGLGERHRADLVGRMRNLLNLLEEAQAEDSNAIKLARVAQHEAELKVAIAKNRGVVGRAFFSGVVAKIILMDRLVDGKLGELSSFTEEVDNLEPPLHMNLRASLRTLKCRFEVALEETVPLNARNTCSDILKPAFEELEDVAIDIGDSVGSFREEIDHIRAQRAKDSLIDYRCQKGKASAVDDYPWQQS